MGHVVRIKTVAEMEAEFGSGWRTMVKNCFPEEMDEYCGRLFRLTDTETSYQAFAYKGYQYSSDMFKLVAIEDEMLDASYTETEEACEEGSSSDPAPTAPMTEIPPISVVSSRSSDVAW